MRAWVVAASVGVAACTGCSKKAPPTESVVLEAGPAASVIPETSTVATVEAGAEAGPSGPCPEDMAYVETSFCPDVERRCLDMEHEETNHLEICHAFAHEQRCRTEERKLATCIDRYEYPNKKGGHPVWMVDWAQSQATCESKGKRLCMASEWTAACEGPEHTPFPYGWERDHDKCNMDSFYIDPKKPGPKAQFFFYSKDPEVAFKELSRLDQSVPSGSMETCKSGFGVYDLPGNFDEWVRNDGPPHEKSKYAGLKGGAWGHVRSQCRPETFSHEPEFTYYFVGFRCCRDPDGPTASEKWTPSTEAVPTPAVEAHDFAPDPLVPVDPPGPSRTKYARTGHRE
jgi:hypothetical protein